MATSKVISSAKVRPKQTQLSYPVTEDSVKPGKIQNTTSNMYGLTNFKEL